MTNLEIQNLPVQTKYAILYALQLYRDIEQEAKKEREKKTN
ncbi:MAG: hypothetical protein ACI4NP_00535 [Thermoguttaceae bacterium]